MNTAEIDRSEDAQAVRRALAGDDAAFAELLRLYRDRVFSFLVRVVGNAHDAEDLAQETFVKAFTKLERYDPERPFISWLFKIAHNGAIDHLRERRPAAADLDDEAFQLPDGEPLIETALRRKTESELFEALIDSLPPLYREALVLRHREGMDLPEIGRVLELPEGTVKIRLFRARDMLKRKLLACGWTERN